MANSLHKQIDIYGPLEQAARCLDLWLAEESRKIDAFSRQRAAALMARYFHYEDEVTDETMLSFLRHYSNRRDLDMEDPTSVRMELKTVLDKSLLTAEKSKTGIKVAAVFGAILCVILLTGGWMIAHATLTAAQQVYLKALVTDVAAHEKGKGVTTSAVWADVKKPLHVRRYQEMTWWQYYRATVLLEARLKE